MNDTEIETRDQILQAAVQIFCDQGLDGARMQQIADAAGVNKAMLHYYFRSKAGLFKECVRELLTRAKDTLQEAIRDVESVDQLVERATAGFFTFHLENPGFIKLLVREIVAGPDRVQQLAAANQATPAIDLSHITEVLERLQKQGQVRRDIVPLHLMMTITGALGSSMMQTVVITSITGADFDEFLEQRRDAIQKIITAGLRPQTKGKT